MNYKMSTEEALEKLFSLHQFGVKLGLDNVVELFEHIGNPQKKLKAIHIAGSNGKGSTASFTASILKEAGYKVGLYTSPHFVRYNERIRVNGVTIPDDYVAGFLDGLWEYIEEKGSTFFEVTTALAFQYFVDMNVDYAVIETGLGGRLDATNVLDPVASVITTISHEHSHILGNTLHEIALEKAGIIKPGRESFIGFMEPEAEAALLSKCAENNSKSFLLKNFTQVDEDSANIVIDEFHCSVYDLPLKGKHQFANSALAILTLNKALGLTDWDIIKKGLKNVLTNSGLQGRYEKIKTSPTLLIDAAHNIEGIESFTHEFKKEYKSYTKRKLIFGAMKDKEIRKMLSELKNYFDEIFVTTIDYSRASSVEELLSISDELGIKAKGLTDPAEDVIHFLSEGNEKDCLVVLGSIYMLGDIKSKIIGKGLDILN